MPGSPYGAGPACAGQLAGGAGGRLQRCGGQADYGHGPCAESLPAAAEYHGAVAPSLCFMERIVNGNGKNPDGQGF